jgi:branched-chain amino acid aminotransferase
VSVPSRLSADRGFLLGDGLFETVRLYRGFPFRLEDHLRRMQTAAARVRIPWPDTVEARVDRELELGRDRYGTTLEDGVLRITLTRGAGSGLHPPDPPGDPTLHLQVRPYRREPELARRGVEARVLGEVAEGALTAGMKVIGYLERIVALLEARALGADEALLRNGVGRVVSGSASNLFVVRGGGLGTPSVADGALPGITRGVILELAESMGLPVDQNAPGVSELMQAEEVFLTSSLRELVPVVRLEGAPVGAGRPGPVFRALAETFRTRVKEELGEAPGPNVP